MKIQGKEKFAKQLAALPQAMKAEIRKAIITSAEEMVDVAKRFVPVKSGALRRSIGFNVGAAGAATTAGNARAAKGDEGLAATVYAGDDRAYYAHMIEFGTAPHTNKGRFAGSQHPGTSAQPFFFPAYRFTRKRAKARLARAVNKGAKKAFGK